MSNIIATYHNSKLIVDDIDIVIAQKNSKFIDNVIYISEHVCKLIIILLTPHNNISALFIFLL